MRFLGWNLTLSTWLLISAFVFPHTPTSSGLTVFAAFFVLLFAFVATGKPASRFVITVLAAMLGATAMLLPGISGAAAVNNAIVGALLFALSLVRPVHAAPPEPATHEGAAEPAKV